MWLFFCKHIHAQERNNPHILGIQCLKSVSGFWPKRCLRWCEKERKQHGRTQSDVTRKLDSPNELEETSTSLSNRWGDERVLCAFEFQFSESDARDSVVFHLVFVLQELLMNHFQSREEISQEQHEKRQGQHEDLQDPSIPERCFTEQTKVINN